MYMIDAVGTGIVEFCEEPRYIKINPSSGCYIQCSKDDAQGVAAAGVAYNLQGRKDLGEDIPEAIIVEREGWRFVFDHGERIDAAESNITNLDDIAVEFDSGIEDIKDALIEIDAQLNGE